MNIFAKKKNAHSNLKRTAIVYDYDGTLASGNIQENSFLPSVDLDTTDFWQTVKQVTKDNDADEILVYMQLMMEKAKKNGKPLTKEMLKRHGQTSTLFKGLKDGSWFNRINEFSSNQGLALEHYIVSSGIKEMIEGSPIAEQFKTIFACKYMYDEKGFASWPSLAINYTTKTQFLFRINKGVENTWNNEKINAFMPENERPLPFTRIIFIGDGDTDIPAMKMTTHNNGHSIAAYDPEKSDKTLDKIHGLISDGRANFVAPADYSEHSQMDIIVKGIIGRIARNEGYRPD